MSISIKKNMSIQGGMSISQKKNYPSSLLLFLDAGNLSSYSGQGNQWFDLSSYNKHFTLYNTPTYYKNNSGYISFDEDSLQYGEYSTTIPSIGSWTAECWVRLKKSISTKWTGIFCNKYFTNGYQDVNFNIGTNPEFGTSNLKVVIGSFNNLGWRTTSGITPTLDAWYQIVGTYNGSIFRQYINGVASGGTLSYSASLISGGGMRIMRRWDSPLDTSNLCSGDLSIIRLYNYALSNTEVLNNFNEFKGRYGL